MEIEEVIAKISPFAEKILHSISNIGFTLGKLNIYNLFKTFFAVSKLNYD